ncbi:MAG: hypothetical protein O7B99_10225, partial [Planctomycetota bacterium]|nr:hypothetical protein [Planctomycetota bacterium]
MKTLIASLAVIALHPAAPAVPEPGPAAVQGKRDEFVEKFRNAQKIGAADEMQRLIRSYQQEAIHTVVYTCEQISIQSSERLEEDMDGLRKAWESVYKTGFVDKCYEYFSLMRPEIKQHRRKLKVQYDLKNRKFLEAEANKDRTKFGGLGMEFKGLAEGFAEIGDWYHASEAWIFYGRAFDEDLRGTADAVLPRVCEAFGKAVAAREKIELKDNNYSATRTRFTHLEKLGYGDPEKATGPKNTGPVEASGAVTLSTSFELVENISAYRRPIYYGDEAYGVWVPLGLRAKGSTAKFLAIEDSPVIMRVASAKVMADVDGDGEGDVEIPTPGRITPVAMEIGQGEDKRPWAFLSAVGGRGHNYNGVEFNMSPTDESMQIFVAPAASLVALVGETQVRIFDDNMDGIYGSKPVEWGHMGLAEDYFQRDLDSIVIGKEKRARPWSEYQEIGGQWTKLVSEGKGLSIRATPVDGIETGTLKLDFKGGK